MLVVYQFVKLLAGASAFSALCSLQLFRCSFVVASFGGSEAVDLQSKNTEQSLCYSEWILEIYWELYKRTLILCSRSEQLSTREFPRRCDLLPLVAQ